MNGEDLRLLAGRAETVHGRPDERLAEVRARIRSARRRRAAGAVAGTSAAVVALVIGVAALIGPTGQDKHDAPPPPANSDTPATTTTRKIVYSDRGPGDTRVGTIHVGGREVAIDQTPRTVRFWDLHVTDAGVVYEKGDGSVWFTDGGRPRQIAEQACAGGTRSTGPAVATGNTGPWAVWFDCTLPTREDLVVFDTGSGREVARQPIPSCRPRRWSACGPDAVVAGHVYFTQTFVRKDGGGPRHDGRVAVRSLQLDVATGQVIPATPQMYADDLRSHPRALAVGDSWRTGTVDAGGPDFDVVGSRLVPIVYQPGPEPRHTRGFDAAAQPVRLRLPSGYHPVPAPAFHGADIVDHFTRFTLYEWLDDDTVALAQVRENSAYGDILTCHLPDGRCHVAAKAPPPDRVRILPGQGLPG